MGRPVLIGVAGGSGSGKTTVARELYRQFKDESVLMIEQDSYYKDQSYMTMDERVKTNYDHPFAFDNDLLLTHLHELLNYRAIEKPQYDFKEHTRAATTVHVQPADVIILEGMLILEDQRIRDMMDIKVFVDTDADVRIVRRIQRDIEERGRSLDSVVQQYLNVVRPMHLQFIEPTKRYANIIIPEGGYNKVALDLLSTKIHNILHDKNQCFFE
ncbi:uridine kinase [Brevibacillus sp. 7WMA2]|uniref:Uridine kinase n=1 Tax=Brevibacillus laterosporus LMG 15441 TaxID=1042163 RepID=A0A075R3B1_BRELA|nr:MULTISPECIES: uridine kinase [Brevibacillus]AIG25658.1 uridine kinase [Brevibacillus laterosporus LMG 15441]AUM64210.1 uridine kinase [Brevibacillus laterosporus]AYK07193.1 uridine kinase [Brevibacillus laterosporus]ERM17428.1 uridine/cytidine kinase [Brevibacillus laterosporus PE36]MBA4531130.1 uridine kinase [Brevibacillus halotolerans]